MKYARILRLMPDERRKQTQKVIDTLKIGGRSEKTTANYVHAIDRFLKYFYVKDIEKLNESDIIEYTKSKYLNNNCAGSTYNINISAIKYFYAINFNKEFNTKLLPHAKLTKKITITLDKEIFLKILNEEKHLKHSNKTI